MLRYPLTHPQLLAALAAAGHGSTVLLADGNYPHATGVGPNATTVFLNLRPGQIPVDDVLTAVVSAIPVEAATVMRPDRGPEPPIFARFRAILPGVELSGLARHDFYTAARGQDLAVAVATGDQRLYANILLTVGVVPPEADPGRR
ncbi:MAG TPA: RbsD/FucU family protein [Micromonosporaceae bacterium]